MMEDTFEDWLKERDSEMDADDGRLSPGTVIGAYRVESFLGKGGFAEVYAARTPDGERVAIKILHRLDEQSLLRFERESSILSRIRHPNIPRLLSFGSCGNRPYFATEMLQAKELPHTDKAVASFIKSVCRAAGALHETGYVHRDIKPSNILWRGETPVLIDFGLAVPISEAMREQSVLSIVGDKRLAVGTPGFSAPEQFAGQVSGPASDVHALGALIGACFGEKLPRCWKRIYLTATNSNPRIRYQTVTSMRCAVAQRHLLKGLIAISGALALAFFAFALHAGLHRYHAASPSPQTLGYTCAPQISVSLPFVLESGQVATNTFIDCQIFYKETDPKPRKDGDGRPVRNVGEMLNGWLVAFVQREYEGTDLESFCDLFDQNFESDLQTRFLDYVKDCIAEMPENRRIHVDSVTLLIQLNEALMQEVLRRQEQVE